MLSQQDSACLYQASPNYILRTIAGEDVLVSVGAGIADFRGYIQMNKSACAVWKQLQEKGTEERIVDALLDEFDVSREQLTQDIHQVLEKLCANHMVTRFEH